MKKLTKLSLLAIIMLVVVMLLTGCANNQVDKKEDDLAELPVYTAEETPDWATFNEVSGVEFKHPSNYQSIGQESLPILMDPDVPGATVNIVTTEFPSVLTFEGYVDASIPGIKSEMDIQGDIKKEYINLNGTKAARLDYVATSEGHTMSLTQILIKKEDTAYVLTLGCLEKDKDAVSEKYEKIIKSFK